MRRAVSSVARREPERDVPLAEVHLDVTVAEQPLELTQPLRADEHLLALREERDPGEVAHREAVRVGRDEPHALAGRRDEHSREDRARVVARRGRHDLPEPLRQRAGGHGDGLSFRLGKPREVARRERAHLRPEPAGFDLGLVVADLDRHRLARELRERVDEEARHEHRRPLALDVGRHADADRELEVRAGERDLAVAQRDLHPRQDGQRPGARGDGPVGGADGFGERARSQRNFTAGSSSIEGAPSSSGSGSTRGSII